MLAGMVAVKAPAIALVLSAGALVVVATLFAPEVAIYAVVFILYSNLAAVGVTFHGVPRALGNVFPILLAIPLARDIFFKREPPIVTPVLLVLLLLLGVQAIGVAFSRDIEVTKEALKTLFLEGVVLYLLVTNVIRTPATLRGVTWALLLAGLLMSAVPLLQQATHNFDDDYGGLAQVDGGAFRTGERSDQGGEVRQARMAGPIGETNRYSQVMLMLVPLGLMRFWGERTRLLRWAALACTASISLGFVLAFSRGGAFGLMCVIGVMVVMRIIDARRLVFHALGIGLLLAAMPQYWKRLSSIGAAANVFSEESSPGQEADGAVKRRIVEMLSAVNVFIDHPLVGVGPGMFKFYAEEYGNEIGTLRRIEGARRAHSLFLEVAAENGGIGLALFLSLFFLALVGLTRARRLLLERDPELAGLVTGYLLALISYMATGIFLHLAYMRYFYLLLALTGAASYVAERRIAELGTDARARPAPALAGGGG